MQWKFLRVLTASYAEILGSDCSTDEDIRNPLNDMYTILDLHAMMIHCPSQWVEQHWLDSNVKWRAVL